MRRATVMALALAGIAFVMSTALAGQHNVVKNGFGCHSQEILDKIISAAASGGKEAFKKRYLGALLTGDCVPFDKGDTVWLEDSSWTLVCVVPVGSGDDCYWSPMELIGDQVKRDDATISGGGSSHAKGSP
jgi:hypothetical protein